MPETDATSTALKDLKQGERSLVMSFLSMSERKTGDHDSVMDELSLSLAVRAAIQKVPN